MTAIWLTIGGLAAGTVAIKAAGPVLLGGRDLPPGAAGVIALLVPALLVALVVTETFAHGGRLAIDARAAGLAAAAMAMMARVPLVGVLMVAAAVTAAVRALG